MHSIVIQLCRMECKEVWSDRAYATEILTFSASKAIHMHERTIFLLFLFVLFFFKGKLFAQIFSGILIKTKWRKCEKLLLRFLVWKMNLFCVGLKNDWMVIQRSLHWWHIFSTSIFFRYFFLLIIDAHQINHFVKCFCNVSWVDCSSECVEWQKWFILIWFDSSRWKKEIIVETMSSTFALNATIGSD